MERAVVNKESMAFHGLSPYQERKGIFFLALLSWQVMGAPTSHVPTLFYRGFCLLIFYKRKEVLYQLLVMKEKVTELAKPPEPLPRAE